MSDQQTREQEQAAGRKKIAELVKDIQFAMLTTVEADGTLRKIVEEFAEGRHEAQAQFAAAEAGTGIA